VKENSTSRLSDDPTDAKERQKQEYYGGRKKLKTAHPRRRAGHTRVLSLVAVNDQQRLPAATERGK
jgi:hypothetical protein